ncbi:MAG: hypothetical protein II277_04410 [Bacteroidales bacterium]|nr:hypothetical protein [Bacteroidales bacterium]
MKRKTSHIISLCLMFLLALTACEKHHFGTSSQEQASLVLRIATRAITPGDGNASDGGGMNDLIVVLVNHDQVAGNRVEATASLSDLSSSQRQTVSFDNITLGSYSLYAFANYNGNSLFSATAFASLQKGDNFTQAMADAAFASLSGTATPDAMFRSSDGAMLLTARKDIEIKLGSNTATVEMLRPLVHFLVELNNHSNHKMMVNQSSLSFSNFNASTSYVIAHDNMNTGTHRALPTKNAEIEIPAHENAVVYECYLYENQASAYNFGMDVNLWSDNTMVVSGYIISVPDEWGGTRYIRNNGDNSISIDGAYSDNCLWTVTPTGDNNGTYYVMSDVGSSPYLCISREGWEHVRMYTHSNHDQNIIKLHIPDYQAGQAFSSVIGHSAWDRYIHYSNGWYQLTGRYSSRAWNFTPVGSGTTEGYQQIASFRNRQLYKVDAVSGKKSPLSEMRRNSQVKVTLNAYFNELNGEFNYAVETWDTCTNNIEFN